MLQSLERSATYWKGQQLVHKRAIIDRLDPRLRLLVMFAYALAVVIPQRFDVAGLGLVVAIVVACLARLDWRRTLRRIIAMDMFMVFLLLLLPFTTPGQVMFSVLGQPASLEGLLHACLIALKANAVVLMLLALLATMGATTLGHAMARLGVSEKLVHLLLFTVRYLDVIGQEYRRMRRAMQARAFVLRSDRHTWRSMGYLIGMLLVHSLERSERIMEAMKCRGFQGKLYLLDELRWQRHDGVFGGVALLCLALLISLNFVSWQ